MTNGPSAEITQLLAQWEHGDRGALDRLTPLVHDELRRIARRHLRNERTDHSLQPTDLVHEAYLRMAGGDALGALNRTHFFAMCAHVMRHILVDHARARGRAKRGSGAVRVSLREVDVMAAEKDEDLLALETALAALEKLDEKKARLVELRYFAGLTLRETAAVMEISEMTVRREWHRAKVWLFRFITEGAPAEAERG